MKIIGVVFILALGGCGGSGGGGASNPLNPPPAGATSQASVVRLLGANPSGAVLVKVGSLELIADGNVLTAPVSDKELDLGNDQNAWAVSTFDLPADAKSLVMNLRFQPIGSVERSGKTQTLDLSGPPVMLVADAAQVRTRNKVVLEIDLARSLVDAGGEVFLFPDFIVRY